MGSVQLQADTFESAESCLFAGDYQECLTQIDTALADGDNGERWYLLRLECLLMTGDYEKALELFHRAAELGHADAYGSIGIVFENGRGAEVDKKKAIHYWELAAMGGDVTSRYNLGLDEENAGNMNRALKHYMIAAGCGYNNSLKKIQNLFQLKKHL